MGLPSPHTLQYQGHLGKRRDTDVMTEEDGEGDGGWQRERGLVMEKRVDNVKYFLPSTSLLGTCIDFCIWKISVFDKVG